MAALTPEQRKDQAKRGADARWGRDHVLKVTHGSPDHPLRIGDIEIDCYVLEDDMRVVTQRSMIKSMNLTRGGARDEGERGGAELPRFATQKWISKHINKDLAAALSSPIVFRGAGIGVAYGYPATILADICDAILAARAAGDTGPRQTGIVTQADILVRGFARVGIVALVDEATGFQRDRAKDALSKILEAFIAKELQPYVRTFPAEFYDNMFRLRGLDFPRSSVKRPLYFGHLTNDVIYKRLAPGVLEELKKVTPRLESGRHKDPLFGRLTTNKGYPKLTELLGSVVTIMTFSNNWTDFMEKLDRRHPRFGDQLSFSFDYPQKDDDGVGL
jgi:hypothetical protein